VTDRAELAEILNRAPFVRWDRFVDHGDEGVVYGWIDRPDDGRADFVLVTFEQRPEGLAVGLSTSSAKHSHELALAIHGTDDGHGDCQRVDEHFDGLVHNTTRRRDR
jgi:hypothetical protein